MITYSPPRYAVITTHNRPGELAHIVKRLIPQLDYIVIIDNASQPPVRDDMHDKCTVIRDDEQPPNLYRLWNVGLTAVHDHAHLAKFDLYDIGVFNDDANVLLDWYDVVATALRSGSYAAASTPAYGPISSSYVLNNCGGSIGQRMCPWAFILRGEQHLMADEDYRWWYGDTHLEWTARLNGGVIVAPGPVITNTLANSTTVGELAEQAGRDGETFSRKWGNRPW